ncbi:MAG: ATP-binding protein [bacterium]|nr:ATP-binding protein [bacterium]
MYNRNEALSKLLKWRDHDLIKVVTGIRRCGKSVVLQMARDAILASGVARDRVAFIDFEGRAAVDLTTPEKVWAELDHQLTGEGKKYVFLDEVQRVEGFERLVDSIYADKQYDCYVTGSNAWMLSGELATYLSGRYVELHLTPFSFYEFADGMKRDRRDVWLDYCRYGSFPYVRRLLECGEQEGVGQYLEGIFNTVLVKDVASRVKMSDAGTIRRIAAYLFDNIGNLTNVKRICDVLSSVGGKVSYPSVATYVTQLCEAFLFYRCDRVDVRGLELLKAGAKYYAVDPGIRYHLNGNRAGDSGRVLENVVYLELMRRHRAVFVGTTRTGREVDFVTRDGDQIAYYQVAETVKDPETLVRELRSLEDIDDNYPKTLITADDTNPVMHNGIRQVCIYDFLSGRDALSTM